MVKYGILVLIKKIILFLILSGLLLANNTNYEMKIYNVILHAVFPNKTSVKVWSDNKEQLHNLSRLSIVTPVQKQENADILLLTNTPHIQSNIPKFICNYKLLKSYKKSAIGGFYWQKGRPNILFLEKNLKKYNIKLPDSMQEYIEE
jgi:hypothetical protein